MARDDWFRNKTWNAEVAAAFEARLKRSRTSAAKAQYLRIQASGLITSSDAFLRRVGADLTKRVIAEYPEEQLQITAAYETLGNFYLEEKDYAEAEQVFRMVPKVMDKNGNMTSEIWQARLASAIFLSGRREKFAEAKQMVEQLMQGDRPPLFNSSRFACFVVLARLCRELAQFEAAANYARMALQLAAIKTPQMYRHPTIGLVNADKKVLAELDELTKPKAIRRFLSRIFTSKQ